MTPEAQRIAIVEACGWKKVRWYGDELHSHLAGYHPYGGLHTIPDYLNDLNAMHEAEKIIIEATETPQNDHRRREWRRILKKLCGYSYSEHTSAAQRAEAFLRTLNLWTE